VQDRTRTGHGKSDQQEMRNRGEHRRTEYDPKSGTEGENFRLGEHRQAAWPNGPSSFTARGPASRLRDFPFASGATGGLSLLRSSAWLRPPNACENSDGIRNTLLASPRAS
jgi:hypothetical protein